MKRSLVRRVNAMTRPTISVVSSRVPSILLIVWMALGAVSFVSVPCPRLGLAFFSDPKAAPQVFLERDNFHVCGIHARTHSAQMIDLKAFGNRTDVEFIRASMGAAGIVPVIPWVEDSIATVIQCSEPQPTPGVRFRNAEVKKPLQRRRGLVDARHNHIIPRFAQIGAI